MKYNLYEETQKAITQTYKSHHENKNFNVTLWSEEDKAKNFRFEYNATKDTIKIFYGSDFVGYDEIVTVNYKEFYNRYYFLVFPLNENKDVETVINACFDKWSFFKNTLFNRGEEIHYNIEKGFYCEDGEIIDNLQVTFNKLHELVKTIQCK